MAITKLQNTTTTIFLIILYFALWQMAKIFEYAPFASLWYAPAGLSVTILILWKNDGYLKVFLCVWCVSVASQYIHFNDQNILRVGLISALAAFSHTLPYWLAIKLFTKIEVILRVKPEGILIRSIAFCTLLLIGSLGAALLGIVTKIIFAGMPLTVAQNIWLSWWIGDYVGAVVLSPLFILIFYRYARKLTSPENVFLLNHSRTQNFLPKEKISSIAWFLIILSPAVIVIAQSELDARIPVVISFLIVLLPIAVLSTRASWGVLVSAIVMSSISIIIITRFLGIIDNAIAYQATLIATAVTALYFYDLVQNFELRAQKLLEVERTLSTASNLLTLNEIGVNIAHELRTPLQTALSSSQRVRRRLEKLDDDWSIELSELKNTKNAINQINNTIESVRNLVKIPTNKLQYCSVNDSLFLVNDLLKSSANQQSISINIRGTKIPYFAKIEQNELMQILMNLISNSIKSSAQTSSKEVTVSLNKLGDRKLSVEVTDSGKGIEKDDLKDLFKLGHSKLKDGLGLGLWVSKSITERQQATLEYIQHDDTQWCFRLTLDSTEYQK